MVIALFCYMICEEASVSKESLARKSGQGEIDLPDSQGEVGFVLPITSSSCGSFGPLVVKASDC